MKYWEVIADNLSRSRLGLRLHLNYGLQRATMWVVAAEREDAGRCAADEKLTAFVELESAIQRRLQSSTHRITNRYSSRCFLTVPI